jgi:hypothetical protein
MGDMKPSERIKQLHLEYYGNTLVIEAASFKAVLDYLDEEAEKPKYACPRCHRIVDDLMNIRNFSGNFGCKHCLTNKDYKRF